MGLTYAFLPSLIKGMKYVLRNLIRKVFSNENKIIVKWDNFKKWYT